MPIPSIRPVVPAILAAGVLIAGCATQSGSSADGGAATSGAGGASTVDVTIQEFSVNPSVDSAPAGEITFNVTNEGPEDIHEFVVIATDLDAGELPTDEDGAVDEEGEGMEVIDEIEDLPVGESEELSVDLEAGHYALICNIFDEEEAEAHYQMGMHTNFEVTD
ncbi:MAG TPA: hypothetical protein VFW95_05395 [Candidatus Limnocylindria bacterium]|nr:hypothetical protein [Candidatus Limnocylindria bacterium]